MPYRQANQAMPSVRVRQHYELSLLDCLTGDPFIEPQMNGALEGSLEIRHEAVLPVVAPVRR
jgi:hypothetical protein